MERIGRQVGGVPGGGQQPTQLGVHVVRREARRVEERGALDELDHGAPGGPRGGAAAGLEAGLGDAVALDANRDPHEVAAGGSAGGPAVGRAGQRAHSPRGASRCSLMDTAQD